MPLFTVIVNWHCLGITSSFFVTDILISVSPGLPFCGETVSHSGIPFISHSTFECTVIDFVEAEASKPIDDSDGIISTHF